MSKHEGSVRAFHIRSETWYAKSRTEHDLLDEIMIGMYHRDGGTTGEFAVRWTMLGGEPTPRLEVYNDAWDALQQFTDLLAWMAIVDNKHVTPKEFAVGLLALGITDKTERINPYDVQK